MGSSGCGLSVCFHSLGLGLGSPPEAHDEAAVVEGPATQDLLILLGVRDLHLCVGLLVMDHVTLHHMGVQTLHSIYSREEEEEEEVVEEA